MTQTERSEETRTPTFENYAYGGLAEMLVEAGEIPYADGALRTLAGPKGFDFGPGVKGFVEEALATEESVKRTARNYARQFQEKKYALKPSDLVSFYSPALSGIDEKDKAKIVDYLGNYDETIGDITKKVTKASQVLEYLEQFGEEDTSKAYGKDATTKANATIKKYRDVVRTMGILDRYTFESMRPDAVEVTRKRSLEALASQL